MKTVAQAAESLGVSLSRAYQLIRLAEVAPARFGRAIVLTAKQVDRMRAAKKPVGRPRKLCEVVL